MCCGAAGAPGTHFASAVGRQLRCRRPADNRNDPEGPRALCALPVAAGAAGAGGAQYAGLCPLLLLRLALPGGVDLGPTAAAAAARAVAAAADLR